MNPEEALEILKQLPDEAVAFLLYAAQAEVDVEEHRWYGSESYKNTANVLTNTLDAEYTARGLDQSDFYEEY